MTRSSACQLATGEDAANPPRSETSTKSRDNAELYRETYGEQEPVQSLIPYMLREFLDADRGFAKAAKARSASGGAAVPS
ncbi:MAG: DUF2274 domain-containing protein, partial [Alphaproteobacteria bacterium]|nr:DUF2274 domain-containing protein [Alphaproteobacteria bacterium]